MTKLANRLPDSQPPLSAAAFNARRDINRDKYAASGYIEPGKHYEGSSVFSYGAGGMWTTTTLVNAMRLGRNSKDGSGVSSSGNPIFHVDGLVLEMRGLNWPSEENNQINLPDAPMAQIETTTLTTRDYAQGDHVVVGNDIYVCIHPDGSKEGDVLSNADLFERDDVVSREDLVGLEVFLVQLGDGEGSIDAVYPYGNVQYRPAAVDNQFSLSTNAMPQSYSAMYLGDTTTTGRGLKWSTLTPEQRNLWAQKSSNNIYIEDGKYYQWQYRARVIRSRGGSWKVATAWDTTASSLEDIRNSSRDTRYRYASPQGKMITAIAEHSHEADDPSFNYLLTTLHPSFPSNANRGVVVTSYGYNGNDAISEDVVYFLSLAKITRLNEGGYHPVYNPMGTKTFRRQDINGDNRWDNVNTFQPSNVAECFKIGEDIQSEGFYQHSGLSGSARSGHPQDYRSDVIYDWQVQDLRMDAHGYQESPDDFANKVLYNGYQADEAYQVMRLIDTTIEEIIGDFSYYVTDNILDEWGIEGAYQGGGYLYNKDKQELLPVSIYHHSSGRILIQPLKDEILPETIDRFYSSSLLKTGDRLSWNVGDAVTFIGYKETVHKSALMQCTDVIATPERLIEALNTYGVDRLFAARWIPADLGSNGTAGVECKARRRVVNPVETAYVVREDIFTVNTEYTAQFESASNSAIITEGADTMLLFQYTSPGTLLDRANFPFRFLDAEFGSVWASDSNYADQGGTCSFNMIGHVPTGQNYAESIAYQIQKVGMEFSDIREFVNVSTGAYSEINHVDINYSFLSKGVKFAPFFSLREDMQLVYGQAMFKGVNPSVTDKSYRTIDVSLSESVTISKGERIKLINLNNSSLEGLYLIVLTDFTATWSPSAFDGFTFDYDDGRVYGAGGHVWTRVMLDPVSASGDNSAIEPTSNIIFVEDLNGEDVARGTMITRRPLGFLPKQKRRNKM